jgi:hypothetical protein
VFEKTPQFLPLEFQQFIPRPPLAALEERSVLNMQPVSDQRMSRQQQLLEDVGIKAHC